MKSIRDLLRPYVPLTLRRWLVPWTRTPRIWLWMTGRRFTCAALNGEIGHSICVNADLTVSCNDQEHEGGGKGVLGDLREQSLVEISSGKIAQRFRKTLAQGKRVIPHCTYCAELQVVDRAEAERWCSEYRMPKEEGMLDSAIAPHLKIRWSIAPADWRQVRGLRFACAALSGESNYNICINADLTVSCNCVDYRGEGILGDLKEQTLAEIFSGVTAQRFRETLAQGRHAIPQCAGCGDLRFVDHAEAERRCSEYHTPRIGIMVENTSSCNLKCRFCRRDLAHRLRQRNSLSLDDVRKVSSIVREYGIGQVSYHNLGEPFLSPRIRKELHILRQENPNVILQLSTNGLLIDTDDKREAALLLNTMFISIDGPTQEILVKYQVGGDFDRAYRNMKDLVAFRNARGLTSPVIEWKYVVFSWNDADEHIEQAIDLARNWRKRILSPIM